MKIIIVFFQGKTLVQYMCLSFAIGSIVIISFNIKNNQTVNVYNSKKESETKRGLASVPKVSVPGVEEKLEEIKEVLKKETKEK